MQFLYILSLRPHFQDLNNWTEETNAIQSAHFNYLKGLFEQGIMKHVGRTDMPFDHEDLHGYAVFETETEEQAQHIMQNDPAVKGQLMTARLLPYVVVFQAG